MTIQKLRERLETSIVSNVQLGMLIGITETMMSKILSGARPIPDGKFVQRAEAALILLEESHVAADRTRRDVILKWTEISKRFE